MRKLLASAAAVSIVAFAFWPGATHSLSAQRGRDERGGRGRRGRPAPPSALLESVTSLACAFSSSSTASWESGQPQVQLNNGSARFTLAITHIDAQEGTAQIAETGPAGDVLVKLAGSNLHILETRPDGALTITTVFSEESREGRLKAVHSRVPDASQYYGDCAFTRR